MYTSPDFPPLNGCILTGSDFGPPIPGEPAGIPGSAILSTAGSSSNRVAITPTSDRGLRTGDSNQRTGSCGCLPRQRPLLARYLVNACGKNTTLNRRCSEMERTVAELSFNGSGLRLQTEGRGNRSDIEYIFKDIKNKYLRILTLSLVAQTTAVNRLRSFPRWHSCPDYQLPLLAPGCLEADSISFRERNSTKSAVWIRDGSLTEACHTR